MDKLHWITVLTLLFGILLLATTATDPEVPKQMKRIYRRFKKGKLPSNGVNMVRHIKAHPDSVTSKSKLLFDLNSVSKHETLIKAQLYFYKRSSSTLNLQIEFSEVSPYYEARVQLEQLHLESRGWQSLDVTETLLKCTNTISTNNRMAVGFALMSDESRTPANLNMEEFQRHHGIPFLIIFSNNTQSLDMDQITGPSGLNEKDFVAQYEAITDPLRGAHRRRRDITSYDLLHLSTQQIRKMDRNLNKLPPVYQQWIHDDDYFNELTNQIEPQPTVNSRSQEKTTSEAVAEVGIETTAIPAASQMDNKKKDRSKSRLERIPWPKVLKEQKKPERGEKIPLDMGELQGKDKKNSAASRQESGCRRESLRLNFDDIGWGLRVIEPKKFDMYYCTGQCSFPYSLGMKPTNHATLQSILSSVRAAAASQAVPQPCCVPDTLSPVTLMYYDQYGNIVIKLYKDMSVDSCSCR